MQMKVKSQKEKKRLARKAKAKPVAEKIAASLAKVSKQGKAWDEKAFRKRPLGMDRDSIKIADDFDSPLPPGIFDSSN